MRTLTLLFYLLFLVSCSGDRDGLTSDISNRLRTIQNDYAPDARTERVEVEYRGDSLLGYTTSAEAFAALAEAAGTEGVRTNAVRLLPAEELGGLTAGIIKVAVANLRSQPGHSRELATQALLGTPIEVLDRQGDWYLVRTPDRYLAWLEPGAFVAITKAALRAYLAEDLRASLAPSTSVVVDEKGRPLSAITSGALYKARPGERLELPGQVVGRLRDATSVGYPTWAAGNGISAETLLRTAGGLTGQPYLWGGTSPNGLDCSGFTKMVYYLNGYVIPRDASQQVRAGTEVELTDDLAEVQAGDLLFFGTLRDDGSERITHVGFYLEEGRLLHAGADNGRITENNLLPGRPLYSAERRKTLLRARRLRPGSAGVETVADAFAGLHTRSSSR